MRNNTKYLVLCDPIPISKQMGLVCLANIDFSLFQLENKFFFFHCTKLAESVILLFTCSPELSVRNILPTTASPSLFRDGLNCELSISGFRLPSSPLNTEAGAALTESSGSQLFLLMGPKVHLYFFSRIQPDPTVLCGH